MTRSLRTLLLALAVLPAAAGGQGIPPAELPPGAGFAWEPVGDRGVNPRVLTFAPDGALWGGGGGLVARLSPVGPGGAWDNRNTLQIPDALLVLGAGAAGDTVLITRGVTTRRSVDGGRTFTTTNDRGGHDALVVGPAGRLLVGSGAVARSDDRGATWAEPEAYPAGAHGPVDALLPLPPEPGRAHWLVLAGPRATGVAVSADSGRTFVASSLWGVHTASEFAAVARPGGPGGAVRVLAAGRTSGQPYARVWASDDGGATWGPPALLDDVADPGAVAYERVAGVLPLGGASALVVLGRGAVHRTDDGGETWAVVGRVPIEAETAEEVGATFATSAVVGPDGRVYVGQVRVGCCYSPFVYRTAAPLAVASEGGPAPAGAGASGLALRAEPNPSAGAVALVLALPAAAGGVRVAVYDSLGREVAVVHEGPLGAGTHRLTLATDGLAPGVYVARAEAGERAATARLALTR